MDNPYTFKGLLLDDKMFFGRDDELREITSFIKGNQSVSVIGPKGIGKTSLMMHLMRDETATDLDLEGNLLVYLDCQTLSTCQQEAILAYFCTGMAEALHHKGLEPELALKTAVSTPSWFNFGTALRRLNQRGLRVVLMLDEFEQLTINPNVDLRFYNGLRSAAGRLKLAFLISLERPLFELTCFDTSKKILSSPFFNIFSQLYLGLLPDTEARNLIRKPMEAAGIVISSQFEDFIYQLVGGQPLALQVACFYACDSPDDLNKIELRTRQELERFYQRDWNSLNQVERDVLQHLSEAYLQENGNPAFMSVLRNLTRMCLVVRAGGLYKYPSDAWAEFVSAHLKDPQI